MMVLRITKDITQSPSRNYVLGYNEHKQGKNGSKRSMNDAVIRQLEIRRNSIISPFQQKRKRG